MSRRGPCGAYPHDMRLVGEMAERSNAAVLKTADGDEPSVGSNPTLSWMLEADPAIRWQAMRDLADASPQAPAAERARVARQGLAAEILARQESDGAWRRPEAPDWLTTLFAMLLLRSTGVDPHDAGLTRAIARLE